MIQLVKLELLMFRIRNVGGLLRTTANKQEGKDKGD